MASCTTQAHARRPLDTLAWPWRALAVPMRLYTIRVEHLVGYLSRRLKPFQPRPIAISHPIHTYTELQQQIHDDLRIQHPEWVNPNGESPRCDSYDARLTEMLDPLTRRRSSEFIVPADGALEPVVTGS